jgi:hypothetical protein
LELLRSKVLSQCFQQILFVRSWFYSMISEIPTSASVIRCLQMAMVAVAFQIGRGKQPVWTWSGFVSVVSSIFNLERCTEPWVSREPRDTGERLQYVCYSRLKECVIQFWHLRVSAQMLHHRPIVVFFSGSVSVLLMYT